MADPLITVDGIKFRLFPASRLARFRALPETDEFRTPARTLIFSWDCQTKEADPAEPPTEVLIDPLVSYRLMEEPSLDRVLVPFAKMGLLSKALDMSPDQIERQVQAQLAPLKIDIDIPQTFGPLAPRFSFDIWSEIDYLWLYGRPFLTRAQVQDPKFRMIALFFHILVGLPVRHRFFIDFTHPCKDEKVPPDEKLPRKLPLPPGYEGFPLEDRRNWGAPSVPTFLAEGLFSHGVAEIDPDSPEPEEPEEPADKNPFKEFF